MGFHFAWIFQLEEGFGTIQEHQLSECHKLAMEFQISIPNSCRNIIQMSNDAAKKTMETNRFCLLKIIECLPLTVMDIHCLSVKDTEKTVRVCKLLLNTMDK